MKGIGLVVNASHKIKEGVKIFVIDRFEGEVVVVEFEGRAYDLPRKIIPSHAKEGDLLSLEIQLEKEATNRRKEKVKNLIDDLFE